MFKFDEANEYNDFDGIILTFEKGRISSWNRDDSTKSFATVGDFDRFCVTPISLMNSSSTSGSFISNYHIRLENKKNGGEEDSSHHMFAFSMQPGSDSFWAIDSPYTFVSLFQFGKDFEGFDEGIKMVKQYLDMKVDEAKTKEGILFDYFLYHSLDISDIFIFIKTNQFNCGKNCITSMTNELKKDFYSYSRTGLSFDQLRDSEDIIDKLVVCAVIEQPEEFEKWRENIKKKYPAANESKNTLYSDAFDRLGHEDYCLNIFNIKMADFVKEIETGLFSNGESGYKDAVMRPRIIFDSIHVEWKNVKSSDGKRNGFEQTLYEKYCSEDKDITRHMQSCVRVALREMFAAAGLLQKTYFARDVVAYVNYSFESFISEVKTANEMLDKILADTNKGVESDDLDALAVSKLVFHKQLHAYVDSVMSIIQGVLHSDKMFFQVPGLSLSLFDVPSKLIIFYTAFIQSLVKALYGSVNDFKFIAHVGLHPEMAVRRLFDMNKINQEKKGYLMVLQIPVASLFSPETFMPTIIHEVGHVLGDELRLREKRAQAVLYTLTDAITDWFITGEKNGPEGKPFTQKLYERLFKSNEQCDSFALFVYNQVYCFLDEYLEKAKKRSTTALYLKPLKDTLAAAVSDFIGPFNLDKLLNELIRKIQLDLQIQLQSVDEKEKILEALVVFTNAIRRTITRSLKGLSLVDNICECMSESFSDIVMLKVSGIEAIDYLKLFYRTDKQFYAEGYNGNLINEYTVERICAVFEVYFNESVDGYIERFVTNLDTANSSEYSWLIGVPIQDKMVVPSFRKQLKTATSGRESLHISLVGNTKAYLSKCVEKWDEKYLYSEETGISELENVRNIFQNTVNAGSLAEFWSNFKDTYEKFISDVL